MLRVASGMLILFEFVLRYDGFVAAASPAAIVRQAGFTWEFQGMAADNVSVYRTTGNESCGIGHIIPLKADKAQNIINNSTLK